MRRLASFLLLGVALSAGAAEIWRWKDAEGVVHYSDSPVPGAERVSVGQSSRTGANSSARPPVYVSTPQPQPQVTGYTSCLVTAPANDAVFNTADGIAAVVTVQPALQAGHRIQVYLNGGAYLQWPESSLTYLLTGLFRGSYTLSVRVLDGNDRVMCAGPAINFHVRQPTLLSPARQQPRPPAKPPVRPMGPARP
jgi:hypothetical protein